jgi:7-methyl-GTP pyrophosphatase
MPASPPRLLLASTSRYRHHLLERLRLPFTAENPAVDETPLPGEAPAAIAVRLSIAKAAAVARRHPAAVVIGADQVAECDGALLGKPGTAEQARLQLAGASGRTVNFHTAVALERPGGPGGRHLDLTRVRFRTLGADQIARYVALDEPFDCAGSFRSESLGIALFEAVESGDPTALVGLPLIWLAGALRAAGLDPLEPSRR